MPDPCEPLILQQLQSITCPTLWVVDENFSGRIHLTARTKDKLFALTNRYDVHQRLAAAGIQCLFNDYHFEAVRDKSIEQVIYRVSKEKIVVHHVINQSNTLLPANGRLTLLGLKGDGIKTYGSKATTLFDGESEKSKNGQVFNFALRKQNEGDSDLLDEHEYSTLRPLETDLDFEILTKPGLFGWNKIDRGSELLMEHTQAHLQTRHKPVNDALDLGCGYGYLSVLLHQMAPCRIVATDNNAGAIKACQANFKHHQIEGEVVADDCAQHIAQRFSLILCNPPFHQGFKTESDLTNRFLESCRRLLRRKGVALFVVNQFIPLEKRAKEHFAQVTLLDSRGGFKIVLLQQHSH